MQVYRSILNKRAFNRLFLSCCIAGLVIFGIIYPLAWLSKPQNMPIKSVKIIGAERAVVQQYLKQTLSGHLGEGFLKLDVQTIRDTIATSPWIEEAIVRKVWPKTVVVRVKEHAFRARLNENDMYTTKGYVVHGIRPADKVPQLICQEDRIEYIWKDFQQYENILSPLGLKIATLKVADRGSVELILDNGLKVVLGKSTVNARLHRFVKAYTHLLAKYGRLPSVVDCRYTSGMAVG